MAQFCNALKQDVKKIAKHDRSKNDHSSCILVKYSTPSIRYTNVNKIIILVERNENKIDNVNKATLLLS